MAKVEIEIGDDGKIGTLPDQVQTFLNSKIDEAFGKGKAAAARDFEAHRRAEADPVERERLKALELENSKLKEAEALRSENYEEAKRQRDERHKAELAERDTALAAAKAEVEKRTARVRELVHKELRAAAASAGARPESLAELEIILSSHVDLDDSLQAFVKDVKTGKAALDADQKPVTIEGLVTQYLSDHPHHKAAAPGRGAAGAGGRSLQGQSRQAGATGDKAVALAALEEAPTLTNVARALRHVGQSRVQ